jgi:hypothetical protein
MYCALNAVFAGRFAQYYTFSNLITEVRGYRSDATDAATFLRCIELPEVMADWSLTSLQLKLIKIGARVVRHARAITFQLAEVAVTGPMVRTILAAIRRLRAPPICV